MRAWNDLILNLEKETLVRLPFIFFHLWVKANALSHYPTLTVLASGVITR